MSFNVYRKNKTLASHSQMKHSKQNRSGKKFFHDLSADILLHEAKQLYYSQVKMDESVRLFEKYLQINPSNDQALHLCGVAYLHLNKPMQAINKLISISYEYSNRSNALLLASMAYSKANNFEKSLEMVNASISEDSTFEEGICYRAKLYMNHHQFFKAEQDYKTAANLPNASFLSFIGLADCYMAQHKAEKALSLYYHALKQLQGPGKLESRHRVDVELKIGICQYQLENYNDALIILEQFTKKLESRHSEAFYYLGQCQIKLNQKQKGLLNLEYCLRIQTNSKIEKKALKLLVQSYLENFQYYEAMNIVKLGKICNIKRDFWTTAVESFMLIIKSDYQNGLAQLNTLFTQIKSEEESQRLIKIRRESSQEKSNRERHRYEYCQPIKQFHLTPHKDKDKFSSKDKIVRKLNYFSTKSVTKPKIQSTRIKFMSSNKPNQRVKTQHDENKQKQIKLSLTSKQKQFLFPLILQFKAYSQFFSNNFLRALDTYEQYENYVKDVLGKESDVIYNKSLCEALLMQESEMYEDALGKLTSCVDIYYDRYSLIPSEPILYKIILLMKMAFQKKATEEYFETINQEKLYQEALDLINNYQPAIGKNAMLYYYKGLIEIILEQESQCKSSLEKTLQYSEECCWKFLYVKGICEMTLHNYYEAIKQFSAGLILQQKSQFYLGRSICFLMMALKKESHLANQKTLKLLIKSVNVQNEFMGEKSQEKSQGNADIFIENCFEDLQKYIELESNQNEISLWVSKILFYNKAYEEAIRSLTKVEDQSEQILHMLEVIEIYEGELENGGVVGLIIKTAFDGQFLSKAEEDTIFEVKIVKNYNSNSFGYLDSSYEKWLIILHFLSLENYPLLLKYLQKQIFSNTDSTIIILLRLNIAIVYLLIGQQQKAINVLKTTVSKVQNRKDLELKIQKMIDCDFQNDQCVSDLQKELSTNGNKLLSHYLPFREAHVKNKEGRTLKIFVKLSIPFPEFPNPDISLKLKQSFIRAELNQIHVQKRIQAPWIKKIKDSGAIQFTEKLDESLAEMGQATPSLEMSNNDSIHLELDEDEH